MSAITGVNHVTFSVPNLDQAVSFYVEVLGCRELARWPEGAYLLAGGTWITLVSRPDYTHLAFSARSGGFDELADRIRERGAQEWQENWTEGDSLYFCDPAGTQLEVHRTTLASRLRSASASPWDGLRIAGDALALAVRPPTWGDPRKPRDFACSPAGVYTIVLDPESRVLLLRAPGASAYEVPNGALEANESPYAAAIRETAEEASIVVEPLGVVDVASVTMHEDVPPLLSIGYVAEWQGDVVVPGDDMAGSEVRWASVAEITSGAVAVHVPSELALYRRAVALAAVLRV